MLKKLLTTAALFGATVALVGCAATVDVTPTTTTAAPFSGLGGASADVADVDGFLAHMGATDETAADTGMTDEALRVGQRACKQLQIGVPFAVVLKKATDNPNPTLDAENANLAVDGAVEYLCPSQATASNAPVDAG